VRQLGAELARDYEDREPLLVGALKACVPFVADLSRAVPIAHALDFVELAGYGTAEMGGHKRIRFLKDLDHEIAGRDVVIVDEVVDTGLTLHYLCRVLSLRSPESLACATLFDRPYRRLVDDLPIRYVGFTVPDEFFVGYGFDVEERWRNLPDLHLVREP
jgi:hypoxanthine phosphoribosyltransferase